jgi:hypothetical protein
VNGKVAPIPDLPALTPERRGSTLSGRSKTQPTHPGHGITAYLETAGTLEYAQAMAA